MGEDQASDLASRIHDLCMARGIRVVTAESCTGGLIAKLLTDRAGSSEFFLGGVVSYANSAKSSLLDVPVELLEAHGAVSAQVVRAMAIGARARLQADVAVAVTGVAGPGGGSASKPVGLTYVAVADSDGEDVRLFVFGGERIANREAAARSALNLLLDRCLAHDEADE